MLDRLDRHGVEQLGEQALHSSAVLDHVRHPGGGPQVVLKHMPLLVVSAHQVDPADHAVDTVRRRQPMCGLQVQRIAEDLVGGDDSGAEDLLLAIDVIEEAVEGGHALGAALGEIVPLAARQDARDHIERDQALGSARIAVNGEGDALAPEQSGGFVAPAGQDRSRHLVQPTVKLAVGRPDPSAVGGHLIKGGGAGGHDCFHTLTYSRVSDHATDAL